MTGRYFSSRGVVKPQSEYGRHLLAAAGSVAFYVVPDNLVVGHVDDCGECGQALFYGLLGDVGVTLAGISVVGGGIVLEVPSFQEFACVALEGLGVDYGLVGDALL